MKAKIAKNHDSGSRGDIEAARIVIIRGGDMTAKGRKQIARWLRRQATFLEKHGPEMAARYTGRWLYR